MTNSSPDRFVTFENEDGNCIAVGGVSVWVYMQGVSFKRRAARFGREFDNGEDDRRRRGGSGPGQCHWRRPQFEGGLDEGPATGDVRRRTETTWWWRQSEAKRNTRDSLPVRPEIVNISVIIYLLFIYLLNLYRNENGFCYVGEEFFLAPPWYVLHNVSSFNTLA